MAEFCKNKLKIHNEYACTHVPGVLCVLIKKGISTL